MQNLPVGLAKVVVLSAVQVHTSSKIGATTSSNTIIWSAAGEKTLSKVYVLLLKALGPMESSTLFPRTPSVVTTTPLFSRTSRSLRPRQRTTTLILVSSPPSSSKSLSFLFVPTNCAGGERILEVLVATDVTDSAGDARPFMGVADCARWNGRRDVAVGGGIARDFWPGR